MPNNSVLSIAQRTYAEISEGPVPPPAELLALPWVPQVLAWVLGPPDDEEE